MTRPTEPGTPGPGPVDVNPYAAPEAPDGPGGSGPLAPWPADLAHLSRASEYREPAAASLVAQIFFALTALAHVGMAAMWMWHARLHDRVAGGGGLSADTAERANDVALGAQIGVLALILLNAIPFLIWFHRRHANLPALGAVGLVYTPGWAVGSFFVPILNLWRPYQIASEVWRASGPAGDLRVPGTWAQLDSGTLVKAWWALFLGAGMLERALGGGDPAADASAATLRDRASGMAMAQVGWIAAAVVTILLIRAIDQRQTDRHARVRQLLEGGAG